MNTLNQYWDFLINVGAGTSDGVQEEEIKALFDMIDKDKSGSLSQRVNIIEDDFDKANEPKGKQRAISFVSHFYFATT